jgi:anion-transporting  ArsA/GET3 family ATPase
MAEGSAASHRELSRTAAAAIDEILTSRQAIFVTGKGGVGKSVVAAALALRARALGMRPVLFECDAPARATSLLPGGVASTPTLTTVAPGILGINQRSDDAIRDYAAATLPSRTVVDLLFENRVAQTFLQAAPSVREMALMGRIAAVADEHGADGPVIVDLHATGHALALLRAPQGIRSVLRSGPLADRATAIDRMLKDPKRVAFMCVAVPEELPVTETLELLEQLRSLQAPLAPVVLNAVVSAPPALPASFQVAANDPLAAAWDDHRHLSAWATRAAREVARLVEACAASATVTAQFDYVVHAHKTLAEHLLDAWTPTKGKA